MKAMLAEPVNPYPSERERVMSWLMNTGQFTMQQKLDGHRLLIKSQDRDGHDGGGFVKYNRNGDYYSRELPQTMARELAQLPGGVVLDGELVGGTYWVFDLIEFGADLRWTHYEERRRILHQVVQAWGAKHVLLLPTVTEPAKKEAFMAKLIDQGAEGAVFRALTSPYVEGRTAHLRKLKFVETVDCVVLEVGRKGKDALALGLLNGNGELYDVGACSTIGKPHVEVGDVVEVRYLYVGANGRLYQPHFERVRTDKAASDCTDAQLKHVCKDVVAP